MYSGKSGKLIEIGNTFKECETLAFRPDVKTSRDNNFVSSRDVKIKNNSASSLANNRILTNGDFTIKPNQGCIFVRDGVSSRWRIFVHRT